MNAAEFRARMAALPEPPVDSQAPHWDYWRHDLWTKVQAWPAATFMNWPCIRHTMIVDHFDVSHQIEYLAQDKARWSPIVGDPDSPSNQRNLVNQAYSLKLWEDTTGRRVDELETIFEFGGGYGAMALVCRRAGFRGRYYIHDLPEFALLQDWWLSEQGLQVERTDSAVLSDLFIGLYSISEIDPRERWKWTLGADGYLLLYSSRFAEYDNQAWAFGLMNGRGDLKWKGPQFDGRPDWYAIGWRP